jgi:hypothetical protein
MEDEAAGGRAIRQVVVRVVLSCLGGGLFYLLWLALALLTMDWESAVWDAAVSFLGPVLTAAGFAAGLALGRRLTRCERSAFWRLFVGPLVGCSVGAAVVYPFGPMLIVFGMLAAGAAAVALREALAWTRRRRVSS